MQGEDVLAKQNPKRGWWEYLVAAAAIAMFVWLAIGAEAAPIHADPVWMAILIVATLVLLFVCGYQLWRRTRFS